MSNGSEESWSNNPNAPQISSVVYVAEKELFAGNIISGILYGTPTNAFAYLPSHYLFDTSFQGSP